MTNLFSVSSPSERKQLLEDIKKLPDREDRKLNLHWMIREHFGVDIPLYSVCPEHDSPMDFVSDVFFEEVKGAIAIANRSGGKTMNFAILDALNSYDKPKCETATLGAIEAQARRCYSYFSNFISTSPDIVPLVKDSLMSKTTFNNQAMVEILTATVTGVNSPHPHKVFADEVELMQWFILQQIYSMAQSTDGIMAQNILGSTRKTSTGVMQRLIDEAEQLGFRVYHWCIWEVIEPLPFDNPEMMKRIQRAFPEMPKEMYDKKPDQWTSGGYYKWEDVLDKKQKLDEEVWDAEWLSNKPGTKGLVYFNFDETAHMTKGYEPADPEIAPIYLLEDYGFSESHPNVNLLAQLVSGHTLYVFDELYLTYHTDPEIVDKIEGELLEKWGLTIKDLAGWIADPSDQGAASYRRGRGAKMLDKADNSSLYLVKNGIRSVRRLLTDKDLFIDERCVKLKGEMQTYSMTKNANGTWGAEPKKENDHGPDALRYGVVKLFPDRSVGSFKNIKRDESKRSRVRPLTRGFLGKQF